MIIINELKRKLRKLKKLEIKIRFYSDNKKRRKLVWDEFFDTKDEKARVRYNLSTLIAMDKETYKKVIDEYFFNVYFRSYIENGLTMSSYDPHLLQILGLPFNAELAEIKKRFRELAKIYHPDLGGDTSKMTELLDVYNQLTNKN
ncbi:J domain-containing protein [Clostridiaceae bacterium M8S5]|nr:J domain-containing protein [Clostridiaceae bacterium M8S5]